MNEEVIWGIFVAENTERFPNFYPIAFYSTPEKALEDIEGLPKDMNYHLVKFPLNRNFAYYHKKSGKLVGMNDDNEWYKRTESAAVRLDGMTLIREGNIKR